MGLFSDIGELFGESTGFGGSGSPNPHNTDPGAWSELYEQALAQINNTGQDPNSQAMRSGIEKAAISQLGELDNNAAGRKKNFQEDMARGFAADTTSLARAKGGTGTLAQAMRPSGQMYDAQARAESRGLNDLYAQATKDLGSLTAVQGDLYGQDLSKNTAAANLTQGEVNSRRGTLEGNNQNTFNAEQIGAQRRQNTIGGITSGGGLLSGLGSSGGK